MSEWQPIETAPKDGTDILVYCGPDFDPMYGVACWEPQEDQQHLPPELRADERDGWMMWWQTNNRRHTWPTHWMPLPEPPISS